SAGWSRQTPPPAPNSCHWSRDSGSEVVGWRGGGVAYCGNRYHERVGVGCRRHTTSQLYHPRLVDITPQQLTDELRGLFRGRLALDELSRGLYATDASPFEVNPFGVAFPKDAEDLSALVRYCHEHTVAIIPRGAGTGVAGESLGPGLVVDLT